MKRISNVYIIFAITALLVFFAVDYSPAAAPEWKFDTTHSRFYFEIDHIFSKVRGHFKNFSGTVFFDPANLKESSINIEIRTKSIDTGVKKRDNHLRSDDFFSVSKYPLITFNSKSITHIMGDQYIVEGDLKIKDVTKTVTLPLTYFGTTPNPFKPEELVIGLETRITIDRFDYNVGSGKFYKLGVAGKDVDLTISLELLRDKD